MADGVVEAAGVGGIEAVVAVGVGAEDAVLADGVLFDDGGADDRIRGREGEAAESWGRRWCARENGCGKAEGEGGEKQLRDSHVVRFEVVFKKRGLMSWTVVVFKYQ